MKHPDETARVGLISNALDVVVYTDDPTTIPHVHIIDRASRGSEFDCCVQLETNKYFTHGHHQDTFNNRMCQMFNEFMRQPCRNPRYKNNYDHAVALWNDNNSSSYVQVREDEKGNVLMPDYSTIYPYK